MSEKQELSVQGQAETPAKEQPATLKVRKYDKLQKDEVAFILFALTYQIIGAIVFYFYTNISSVLLAFKLPTGEWSLETFKYSIQNLADSDGALGIGIKNTTIFFVKDILMIAWQFVVSYFFYKKIKGARVFQMIFYIPGIISGVAMANMFAGFITPSGPLGALLTKLGVDRVPEFLADSRYANGTMLVYTIWLGWAGNMLLFCGTLARIPVELLESARLDGISGGKELTKIILPLVWPTISTIVILTMTGFFGAGGPVLLFTKGEYKTWTIGYWLFDKIKYVGTAAYNEVSATGLLFTLVGAPIIMGLRWLMEKIPAVEY
jgi:ABC-type sugar transport system permease subunit